MAEPTGISLPDMITVYGVDTCEDTVHALRYLATASVPHRYVRLDADAEAKARLVAAGHLATPVVVMPSGQVLVEPSEAALAAIVTSAVDAR